jgi:glycosyltransferase involved in cell wall biosynthesis
MPLISVIIPVFNGENTIKETIKSVLKQTFCTPATQTDVNSLI